VPEYPPNSYTSKVAKPTVEKEKVEKVVVGEVIRRKPSLGARFKQTFVGGDAKSVGHYILADIVIPTVKDLIADIVSQGIQKTLYGDSRPASRSTASRIAGVGYTAYHRAQQATVARPDPRMVQSRNEISAPPALDSIILDTRAAAELVIDNLVELIGKYEQASVTDLYDLIGEPSVYTYNRWGWQDIKGMGVDYVRGGYLLRLPSPVVLTEA
jgi:hypothetical protein